MALAKLNETVDGEFTSKDSNCRFEFSEGSYDEHGKSIGATHTIFVNPCVGWNRRYARVLKTVAYVAVDEDDSGKPVWEKWNIKKWKSYKSC